MTTYEYGQMSKLLSGAMMEFLCEPSELMEQLYELLKNKTTEGVQWFLEQALTRNLEYNTIQSAEIVSEAHAAICSALSMSCPMSKKWVVALECYLTPIGEEYPEDPDYNTMCYVEEVLDQIVRLYGFPTARAAVEELLKFLELAELNHALPD